MGSLFLLCLLLVVIVTFPPLMYKGKEEKKMGLFCLVDLVLVVLEGWGKKIILQFQNLSNMFVKFKILQKH